MWIFLNDAFVSIVADRHQPGHMRVRARLAGDIERVFPAAEVFTPDFSDYRFHAVVPMVEVMGAIGQRVKAIDYPDFKGSISKDDDARYAAYSGVWGVMQREQERRRDQEERPRRSKKGTRSGYDYFGGVPDRLRRD